MSEATKIPELPDAYDARKDKSLDEYLDDHPEFERAAIYAHYVAGWKARTRAAVTSVYSDEDASLVREIIDGYEAHARRIAGLRFSDWEKTRELERRVIAQGEMLRSRGLDPLDAPLWRRIAMQRREIKRLTGEADRLSGELARLLQEQGGA